jgi:hypothetical protein
MSIVPDIATVKKHAEKIVLAVALLALISTGGYFALNVGKLRETIRDATLPGKSKGATVKPLDFAPYTNALAELTQPSGWTNMPANPFLGWPTNVIIQISLTNTPTTPVRPTEPQFSFVDLKYRAFKLLFRAYSWNADEKRAYNFQINFIDQALTLFVPDIGGKIADRYRDTGYRIANFERILTNITDSVGQREIDVSRLTIQRSQEEPIVLTLNKVTIQSDPVATLRILGNLTPKNLRRGDSFEADGKKYNVVDITPKQMLILDPQSKDQKPIVVPRSAGFSM